MKAFLVVAEIYAWCCSGNVHFIAGATAFLSPLDDMFRIRSISLDDLIKHGINVLSIAGFVSEICQQCDVTRTTVTMAVTGVIVREIHTFQTIRSAQ